jgi:hypothetical protein
VETVEYRLRPRENSKFRVRRVEDKGLKIIAKAGVWRNLHSFPHALL